MGFSQYQKVVDKIDVDYGGVGGLITGSPGCGKSNLMARMAIIDVRNGLRVIWRAKETCQWAIFTYTDTPIEFWIKEGLEVKVFDRKKRKTFELEEFGAVNYWKKPNQIVSGIKKGRINVIQTIPVNQLSSAQHKLFIKDWIGINIALTKKQFPGPVSEYFDEVEDLVPESKPGFYRMALGVANAQKELRKNDIHFFGASHGLTEIFWVMRNKIPWKIYMRGASPDKNSKVYQSAIDKLKPGEAWIEERTFEKVYFKFVGKPKNMFDKIKLPRKLKASIKKKDTEKFETLESYIHRRVKEGATYQEISNETQKTAARIAQILNENK